MSDDSSEFETALELCSSERRRIVLATLINQNRPLSLNDLTKVIINRNHQRSITDISGEAVGNIHQQLYHVHVPALTAAKVVTYDDERKQVIPTDRLEQVRPYVATIVNADPDLDITIDE